MNATKPPIELDPGVLPHTPLDVQEAYFKQRSKACQRCGGAGLIWVA